jgi:hypothetical protein
MSLFLSEQRRSRRVHRKPRRTKKKRSALEAPFPFPSREGSLQDDQVLSFGQWCQLNHISERTGRRILKSGNGPAVVQLSTKRIGITVGANRAWQKQRERG